MTYGETAVHFAHDIEDDFEGFEFSDMMEYIADQISEKYTSFDNVIQENKWEGREGRIILENQLIQVAITEYCGLARELRRQLRSKHASLKFPVVHSTEVQIKALPHEDLDKNELCPPGRPRAVNGAISYMPNLFGLMMAGHIIQAILKS